MLDKISSSVVNRIVCIARGRREGEKERGREKGREGEGESSEARNKRYTEL